MANYPREAPSKRSIDRNESFPSPPKKSKLVSRSENSSNEASSTIQKNGTFNLSHSLENACSISKSRSQSPTLSSSEATSSCPSSSESSSSEEEEDDEDEDDDDEDEEMTDGLQNGTRPANIENDEPIKIPHPRTSAKPPIRAMKHGDLQARLSAFIPALKAANEDLERDIAAGNSTTVEISQEDNEEPQSQYIEMDLGLGVLEEKNGKDDSESSDDDSDSCPDTAETNAQSDGKSKGDTSILSKLMGEKSKPEKPIIEEMGQ